MAEPFKPKPGEPYWLVEGRHGRWVAWVNFRPSCGGWKWTSAKAATPFRTREAAEAAIRLIPAALPPSPQVPGRLRVTADCEFLATEHVDIDKHPAVQEAAPTEPSERPYRGFDVVHTIKCWPAFFEGLLSGDLRLQIRGDDREHGFEPDDVLRLQEFVTHELASSDHFGELEQGYTGRELFVIVTHVLRSTDVDGIGPGFVALSIKVIGEVAGG